MIASVFWLLAARQLAIIFITYRIRSG